MFKNFNNDSLLQKALNRISNLIQSNEEAAANLREAIYDDTSFNILKLIEEPCRYA